MYGTSKMEKIQDGRYRIWVGKILYGTEEILTEYLAMELMNK